MFEISEDVAHGGRTDGNSRHFGEQLGCNGTTVTQVMFDDEPEQLLRPGIEAWILGSTRTAANNVSAHRLKFGFVRGDRSHSWREITLLPDWVANRLHRDL